MHLSVRPNQRSECVAHGLVFDNKGERNIWFADPPDFVPRQVTHYKGDEGQAIASVRLTPDGKTIVYARGSEANKEGTSANPTSLTKMPKQQAWAVNVSGVAAVAR